MPNTEHDLFILEEIERNPETTQAGLAGQLGVAVGSVNWYLKRLIGKGYIKATQLQRRKLHYFLTPAGLSLKLKLTRNYMDVSLRVYRELRQEAQRVLAEVKQREYTVVRLEGRDDALEILRLTCLEQGLKVAKKPARVPSLRVAGTRFLITWPD